VGVKGFIAGNDRAARYTEMTVIMRHNRREIELAETVWWNWSLL